mgnify:CR=1 FL=1
MIVENVNSIVEISLALLCLHLLNKKKIIVNIAAIPVVVINILLMELINTYQVPATLSFVVYFAIAVYSITEFENSMRGVLVDLILLIINMGIMQGVAMMLILSVVPVVIIDAGISLICNIAVLILMILFDRFIGYSTIKHYVMERNWLSSMMVLLCVISLCIGLISIKNTRTMTTWLFVWIVFFCIIMFSTWYHWIKQKEITKEREADLQVQKRYYDAYDELFNELRVRQHDYKNHLQALQNMSMLDAVDSINQQEQNHYFQEINYADLYSGLLKCENSVVAGFLYGKFKEAESQQIHITYNVEVFSKQFSVSTYIIIETLGILLDNAIEAVCQKEEKQIWLEFIENEEDVYISIKNEASNLSTSEVMNIFDKDYSTKGTGRGIGLYKIKQYASKYNSKIETYLEEQNGRKYLDISLTCKKKNERIRDCKLKN